MKELVTSLIVASVFFACGCRASSPGTTEEQLAAAAKKMTVGGKDWPNPTPDTAATVATGMEHFRHHCGVCHGLDGHNTGVPFAAKMSPPVADLGEHDVQQYSDGQLKWIIENGIRFSGMPGWNGVLEQDEMWSIVRFLRHLPEKGSKGIPAIYKEADEEHHEMENNPEKDAPDHHDHH